MAEEKKPNVIFILTDDQGYGDLSLHGHPFLKTPHIDKLAKRSVRFDNFYVSPSCSPTRAALMSGMHEFKCGVTHTIPPRQSLNKTVKILPQMLKKAGYFSGFIGKWHLNFRGDYAPFKRGFDWYARSPRGPLDHFDVVMEVNGKRKQTTGFREDVYFDEAIQFTKEAGDKPFFLYLCTYSPHTPLDAPKELFERHKGKMSDKQALYMAMIENIDDNVGKLMAYLKESGLDKDTMVILMNDNGVTTGLDVYNGGMRGSKCTIWEGGSKAFAFWHWPRKFKQHSVASLTSALDLFPTLCDYAGVEIPADIKPKLDGFSLRPLLENAENPTWEHEDRYVYHHVARWPSGMAKHHKYAMAGVRQGNYLLLRSQDCGKEECKKHSTQCTTMREVAKGGTSGVYCEGNAQYHWGVSAPGRWSLYNVKDDKACLYEISKENAEIVSKMGAAYDKWWDTTYPTMIEMGGDAKADADAESFKW